MKRNAVAALLVLLLSVAVVRCNADPGDPPHCDPVVAIFDAGTPDVVWGFADLHAHPAIEKGFGGRLIWGTALDNAPVNATELPMIEPCPIETHDPNAASPIDRDVGSLVFPHLAAQANFAHAPIGDLTFRPSTAWPNARDVIHQGMNVASIRRAYEGGLRLMFASTTHNQVIGALLQGPNVENAFVPDPAADYVSARLQLEMIQQIVSQNQNWMGIAKHAADARALIGAGKLAIVLSLEMDGLTQDQTTCLIKDFGVAHVIPIHLVDNDVGGTAATSALFNAASSLVSEIYRSDKKPGQYIDVAGTTSYGRGLGWPLEIVTLSPPLFASIQNIPYPQYQGLCYEPLSQCAGSQAAPTSYVEIGEQNLRGLCSTSAECLSGARPGAAWIAQLMQDHLFVDLSHMSARAVDDTLAIDAGWPNGFPLIASHGGFTLVSPGDQPTNERNLAGDAAAQVVARGGVFGISMGLGGYDASTLVEARGGPLLTFDPSVGRIAGCVAPNGESADAGGVACETTLRANVPDPNAPVDSLQVQTAGGISDLTLNAHPFVRVELDGPDATSFQHRVFFEPMVCTTQACTATVTLGSQTASVTAPPNAQGCATPTPSGPLDGGGVPYTLGQIESVTLEWLYLGCDLACQDDAGAPGTSVQCSNGWNDPRAPVWTIDQAQLAASSASGDSSLIAQVGPRTSGPIGTLDQRRGALTLFQKSDLPNPGIVASGHLFRITMWSGQESDLLGANASSVGANVCVALRQLDGDGVCAAAPPPAAGAEECPAGWWPMNQRGEWGPGTELYTFARSSGPESAICGLDVAVLDWAKTSNLWSVDEVRVEEIEDPVGNWIKAYAGYENSLANRQAGRIAFGTDFNGVNGLMEISENGLPEGSPAASFCPVPGDTTATDAGPLPMVPMRFLHSNGTLGDQVRIDERGLATYGLLADLLAIIRAYPGCGQNVHDSIMLSAEATIRAWETIEDPSRPVAPMPQLVFDCTVVEDGGAEDASAGEADAAQADSGLIDAGTSDASDAGTDAESQR